MLILRGWRVGGKMLDFLGIGRYITAEIPPEDWDGLDRSLYVWRETEKMKTTFILCVATILIGLPGIAWGHWPPEPYRAVEIPDDRLPVMDGDLSDWEWVPEEYMILWEDFNAGTAGADFHKSKENIDPSLIVGWNAHTNRLYFAAEVYDNKHIINHTEEHPDWINVDDCLYVMVDADHSGGEYAYQSWEGEVLDKNRHHAQATAYIMSVSAPSTPHVMSYNPGDWVTQPSWVEVGGDTQGQINTLKDTETTTFYEMSVVPFDFLSWVGREYSKVHSLKEGEIIGLSVAFQDFDIHIESDSRRDIFFGSFICEYQTGKPLRHGNADYFSDFLLVPAEEEDVSQVSGSSWGRIKSTFLGR